MDPARIAALLHPYLAAPLSETQLTQVVAYLDLLQRWNARTNLTSIRDPEIIVTRHFGESFFLAQNCVGAGAPTCSSPTCVAFDLGSGAGFPAIPLKILHPELNLTLVEAHHTKAVFLREVLRTLHLHAEVRNLRAETLPDAIADLVTFRAVERFDAILPIAARLLRPGDSPALAILISSAQIRSAQEMLPNWHFQPPIPIPGTKNRVIELVEPT
jgi:16S rRNA (guanine527-N7)-methyltransferase